MRGWPVFDTQTVFNVVETCYTFSMPWIVHSRPKLDTTSLNSDPMLSQRLLKIRSFDEIGELWRFQ